MNNLEARHNQEQIKQPSKKDGVLDWTKKALAELNNETIDETLSDQGKVKKYEEKVESLNFSLESLLTKLAKAFWLLKWLKLENKELKQKVESLEKVNEFQNDELEKLRQENQLLKVENERLKKQSIPSPLHSEVLPLQKEEIKKNNKILKQENIELKRQKEEDPLIAYLNNFPNKKREYLPDWVESSTYIWQVEKYYVANQNLESYDYWLNKHHDWSFSLEIDDWWNNTFIKLEEAPTKEQIEFVRTNYEKLETSSFSLAPWDIMSYSLFEKIINNDFSGEYFIPSKSELTKENFKEPKQQIGLYKNWWTTEAIYLEKDKNSITWETKYLIEFDNSWTFMDNRETINTKNFPSYKQIKQSIEKWLSNL